MPPVSFSASSKTVLLLGGRGFLGGFISASLKKQGFKVISLVRTPQKDLNENEVHGDISNLVTPQSWERLLKGVTAVINASGILRQKGKQSFETIHVKAPFALAQACAQQNIRFIQISALGDPSDGEFIASKHRFDEKLLALPNDTLVFRPSVVYSTSGSYGGTSLLRALACFPFASLLPGKSDWLLQPISSEQLGEIVASSVSNGSSGIYEVGCKTPLSLKEYQLLWRSWFRVEGKRSFHVPKFLVDIGVRFFEVIGTGPVGLTMWKMLQRNNVVSSPKEYERREKTFGVPIKSVSEVLSQAPSQQQDRISSLLYFVTPWLKWSVVVLWVMSGIAGLALSSSDIQALSSNTVLESLNPVLLSRVMGFFDIGLGLALVVSNKPRSIVLVMFFCALFYFLALAFALPQALWEPWGGLIKNIVLLPTLAVLWVLVERR